MFLQAFSYILCMGVVYCQGNVKLQAKILKGPIFGFLPEMKEHHLVTFSLERSRSLFYTPTVYTVDFSPINQPHFTTLLNLFIGKNVPAEIRVREIPNVTIDQEEKIFEEWVKLTNKNLTYEQSQQISDSFVRNIKNTELRKFVNKAIAWDKSMNLYTNNCQHFSDYLLHSMH